MSDKAIDIKIDEKAPQNEKAQPTSKLKADRQAFVDIYAKRNPVKYALKKKALKAWVEEV